MKKLVLNDSRQVEVQSASASGGVLRVRIILTTAEALKAMFQDNFATQKMTLFENQQVTETFENYTEFKYIKEEVGGIYEVELRQKDADTDTIVRELREKLKTADKNLEAANEQITDLQMAICELYEGMGV